jgi:glycosyltransferase involved in cell wall biosynthesis
VVASDLPGVREPIRRTRMGELAAPRDADSLAAAIRAVLAAPDVYRARAAAAREAFSVETTLDEYEAVYRRAIARHRSERRHRRHSPQHGAGRSRKP